MEPRAGKKNAYRCQKCGGRVITVDRDEGVTPFMITCRSTDGCDGMMHSAFYSVPKWVTPQFEWYSPEQAERNLLEPATRGHVESGGLLLRPLIQRKEGL